MYDNATVYNSVAWLVFQYTQLWRMHTVRLSLLSSIKNKKPQQIGYQSAAGPQLQSETLIS